MTKAEELKRVKKQMEGLTHMELKIVGLSAELFKDLPRKFLNLQLNHVRRMRRLQKAINKARRK